MKCSKTFCVLLPVFYSLLTSYLIASDHIRYKIQKGKIPELIHQSVYKKLEEHLKQNPEVFHRLTDPTYTVPRKDWGYHDQYYPDHETMMHLISLQIKKMIELEEITQWSQVFDPKYGIGSKNHKDKGTINNVFSLFGHPVRDNILQGSDASTLTVYHIFRKTIKNELKSFARSRPLEWHLKSTKIKTEKTLEFLFKNQPEKTKKIQKDLLEINLSLEVLVYRALESDLLS